jgi:hypothetical protein
LFGLPEHQRSQSEANRRIQKAAHTVFTPLVITDGQNDALVAGLDHWVGGTGNVFPSCSENYRAWFPSGRLIDGYNSNSFVYDMLAHNPEGKIEPPPKVLLPDTMTRLRVGMLIKRKKEFSVEESFSYESLFFAGHISFDSHLPSG